MKTIKQIKKTAVKYLTLIKNTLITTAVKYPTLIKNTLITTAVKYLTLIKNTLITKYNKIYKYFLNKLNATNKKSVSFLNKLIISSISLLFVYIFYLLIPNFYDKLWIQNNVKAKLLNEFNINFNVSSDIKYEILPSPHFTFKNVIISNDVPDKLEKISEIKNLKIFISKKNFFNKKKFKINKILIDRANFIVINNNINFYKNFFDSKFSKKKILIKKSNIFFRKKDNEIISILKISKASLFYEELNFSNKIDLKITAFKTPINLKVDKKFLPNLTQTKIEIIINKLKLKILNESNQKFEENQYAVNGSNLISAFGSKLNTNYNVKNSLIIFESDNQNIKKNNRYKGRINLNPFDFDLDIHLNKFNLVKLINSNLIEVFKTKLLFNENIKANIRVNANKDFDNKLFDNIKIFLNINNGKINFNKSTLYNNKIGSLRTSESGIFFKDNILILNSNLTFDVKDHNKLHSFFNINKKHRRPIKKIFMSLDYNFFDNQIMINDFKVDNRETSQKNRQIIANFNNIKENASKNFIKNKIFFNKLLSNYDG